MGYQVSGLGKQTLATIKLGKTKSLQVPCQVQTKTKTLHQQGFFSHPAYCRVTTNIMAASLYLPTPPHKVNL